MTDNYLLSLELMWSVDEEAFNQIVSEGIDAIPEKYAKLLDNVAFTVQDEPSPEQRHRLKLDAHHTLFGLYEGIPMTKRGAGYNLVLPDKITIFKGPIEAASRDLVELKERVHHTVWHEVAHYFGLGHQQIYRLDGTAEHYH